MANSISVLGRLGRDGEGKNVSGTALFEFSIAEDVGYGDRKTTNWWKVQLWGKQAESKIVDYLVKGQQVLVFGEAKQRPYTNKDGTPGFSMEIRANSIQLAGSKGDNAAVPHNSDPVPSTPRQMSQEEKFAAEEKRRDPPKSDDFDDSIPF